MAKAPRNSPRHVSDAVEDMPDIRAPGCAGCRNSRLKSIISEEAGLRALTRWAQLWADGRVPEHMAAGWRDVLGNDFDRRCRRIEARVKHMLRLFDQSIIPPANRIDGGARVICVVLKRT